MFAATASLGPFAALTRWFSRDTGRDAPLETADDADRDRRDFLMEMMDGCPDAFASETDIHCVMHCYPGRF